MHKFPNQNDSIEMPRPLLSEEIAELEQMRLDGIQYDQIKRNQKQIKIIAMIMALIAGGTVLDMLLTGHPTVAVAIVCAFGTGYLISPQKPAGGA